MQVVINKCFLNLEKNFAQISLKSIKIIAQISLVVVEKNAPFISKNRFPEALN